MDKNIKKGGGVGETLPNPGSAIAIAILTFTVFFSKGHIYVHGCIECTFTVLFEYEKKNAVLLTVYVITILILPKFI